MRVKLLMIENWNCTASLIETAPSRGMSNVGTQKEIEKGEIIEKKKKKSRKKFFFFKASLQGKQNVTWTNGDIARRQY